MKKTTLILLIAIIVQACSESYDFNTYNGQLLALRAQYKHFNTHAPRFFLFGMGNRSKFVYKDFKLTNI